MGRLVLLAHRTRFALSFALLVGPAVGLAAAQGQGSWPGGQGNPVYYGNQPVANPPYRGQPLPQPYPYTQPQGQPCLPAHPPLYAPPAQVLPKPSEEKPKTPDKVEPTPTPEEPAPTLPETGQVARGDTRGVAVPMFGDIIGGPTVTTFIRQHGQSTPTKVRVPQVSRGGFKIADNESPRPMDRVFVTYNYYNDVQTFGGPNFNLHREMLGFEKTFFDGNASFGMRLPFLQLDGSGGLDDTQIGDLSFIFKWAFINDLETGNVMSAGLVVTAPTGDDFSTVTGQTIHSTLLQPYVGLLLNRGRAFVQGFSSMVFPTDSDDVTFWSNDLGIGYWLYRSDYADGLLRGVVPMIEAHVATPLNHRNSDGVVYMPDWVVMTAGVQFYLGNSTTLGLAAATPLTGPRLYDVQGVVTFNFRF